MGNCIEDPDSCDGEQIYNEEKKKFEDERIKDGNNEINDLKDTFKERKVNKTWNKIFPLNNYDFNYKEYTLNNNNRFALGITNQPNMSSLINSSKKLKKFADTVIFDPTPNNSAQAGVSDINNVNDSIKNNIKKMKNKYKSVPIPYPSFYKDFPPKVYPTSGKYSSSYFMKVGHCKSNIKNKIDCESEGFTWKDNSLSLGNYMKSFFFTKNGNRYTNSNYSKNLKKKSNKKDAMENNTLINKRINYQKRNLCYQDGRQGIGSCNSDEKILDKDKRNRKNNIDNKRKKLEIEKIEEKKSFPKENPVGFCYKPKFIYIDNSPQGIGPIKGYAPSLVNDILNIAPHKLFGILSGYNNNEIPNNCNNENFINYDKIKKKNIITTVSIILIAFFLYNIINFFINKN